MGIKWSDSLSMSNSEIDAEHKHLISLVNRLNAEIASQQREQKNIQHIVNLMLEDSIAHFAHEERLFAVKSYPDAEEHKQIHETLLHDLKQALKDIQNTDFVKEWVAIGLEVEKLLVDHVLNEDTKYIQYLRTDKS